MTASGKISLNPNRRGTQVHCMPVRATASYRLTVRALTATGVARGAGSVRWERDGGQ